MRTLACFVLAAAACSTPPADSGSDATPRTLAAARSWVVQLDGVEKDGAVERLAACGADVVVIEAVRTVRGNEDFDTAGAVERIRARSICLAYVNVGQAEDYRTYWTLEWKAPREDGPGYPDFIVTVDPDGWTGNYPVSFWDKRWQARLWGSERALLDRALADGFDGVFLDWVLGYAEPAVVSAALEDGVDAGRAMATLIRDLRTYARRRKPGFLVVAQNAAPLGELVPELYGWVDGVTQESVSFYGKAGAGWDDADAADLPMPATGDWLTET
ncbi:MAG: endo alpha-1,4 polygalactosaminidase, partial [Planctomycetota bacterium]|nr:endo alpha-1,4 polygalactosaminidase [Planctomycetota bacterium]